MTATFRRFSPALHLLGPGVGARPAWVDRQSKIADYRRRTGGTSARSESSVEHADPQDLILVSFLACAAARACAKPLPAALVLLPSSASCRRRTRGESRRRCPSRTRPNRTTRPSA